MVFWSEKIFSKKGLTYTVCMCYTCLASKRGGSVVHSPETEVPSMTTSEVILLLNLIAVVVFGILGYTKK